MENKDVEILSKSIIDTNKIGEIIAKHLKEKDVILLSGDLGAGKTSLTKAIAKGLGIKEEVNSPTFNILKCYFKDTNDSKLSLYHIDAYRLEDVNEENKNIGLEEVIDGDGVAIIEWPQFIEEFIDKNLSLNIQITINNIDNSRNFNISTISNRYDELICDLIRNFK